MRTPGKRYQTKMDQSEIRNIVDIIISEHTDMEIMLQLTKYNIEGFYLNEMYHIPICIRINSCVIYWDYFPLKYLSTKSIHEMS